MSPKPTSQPYRWGDQQNGTYVNPVLPADYSDIDAIRVGNDYYAISSTMHFAPGMLILHSKDLLNWTLLGHAVNDLRELGPNYNWDKMNRDGRGVWAGSIRYHAGKFWIYFATPDEGIFMTTATNPAGPWSLLHAVKKASGWNDCCPLWDSDAKLYLVCTNFADNYKIHSFQLTPNGEEVTPGSDKVIHQSRGSEANKLYKFNGRYYHLYSEDRLSQGRVVMMERSRSMEGPWETKQLNKVNPAIDREPNQGGLIQIPSGAWWFLTHQGTTGHWEGRTMSILPVTWINSWPILGTPDTGGLGTMAWSGRKPIAGFRKAWPQTDDYFDRNTLAVQWEWNYQPRSDKWSVSERPGFLRLHAFKPLLPSDLLKAGNTISQRSMRTGANEVTAKLDLAGMADGQQAGLCHFAAAYSWLGISQTRGSRQLMLKENGTVTAGPIVTSQAIWLRSTWDENGLSTYSYALDGTTFQTFGKAWQLAWGNYRGDRVGVFTYNDDGDRGYVDVDYFKYTFSKSSARGDK